MLDIQFIREHAEEVAEKSKQKGYDVNINHLLEVDERRRSLTQTVEQLRAQRNDLAAQFKQQKPSPEHVEQGKKLKEELTAKEAELEPIEKEFVSLLKAVPNLPADDVPIGASEAENKVAKEWGTKPQFDFKPRSHWELGAMRGWIDKDRAAKVAGARFAYLMGDLVKLQFAIVQYVLSVLTNEETLKQIIAENDLQHVSSKPFLPVLPPFMLRTEIFDAMDRLEPRDDRYKVGEANDELWLEGSAEHVLGPLHMNETLDLADLPLRYLGYATSFRREAGTYGKDLEGIIRMHQFDKLEMESFVNPEGGLLEHHFFVAIQEYLMQQLKLPYRVLQKCTADIGKPNARGVDIEVWMPSREAYLETHTADYMTDYQARRLGTKVKSINSGGEHDSQKLPTNFVHTNDATAFALGRIMAAILENYQDKDATVHIPEALKPFIQGVKL